VSHRELDPARSTPEQPVHTHTREQLLKPGERAPVDIEIWPSATLFRERERLRVVIQGQDIYREGLPNAPFARHEKTRNRGTHVIHTGLDASAAGAAGAGTNTGGADKRGASSGGATPSHLLIAVVPPS
jgi:predicted acyl esterase